MIRAWALAASMIPLLACSSGTTITPEHGSSRRLAVVQSSADSVTVRIERTSHEPDHAPTLVAVARDLAWIGHAAATPSGDGWRATLTLPHAGAYSLFAVDEETLVAGPAVSIGSDGGTAALDNPEQAIVWRGYRVRWSSLVSVLTAERAMIVSFDVTREDHTPATAIAGEVGPIAVSSDASQLVIGHRVQHAYVGESGIVHEDAESGAAPDAHASELRYHLEFPRAGRYKLWPLIRVDGTELDAAFTVDVQP